MSAGDLQGALKIGLSSARANAVPTCLLWAFAALLVTAYYSVPAATEMFETVRLWQEKEGAFAVLASRVVFNGVLPGVFLLSVKSIRPKHPFSVVFAQAMFGCLMGLACDMYFRLQCVWFGTGTDFSVLALKTLTDQFIWTVAVIAPVNAVFFFWLGRDFSLSRFRRDWPSGRFLKALLLPNLVANWIVGIPAIFATYAFPVDLQIHVNGLVSAFWMLMCLQIGKRSGSSGNVF